MTDEKTVRSTWLKVPGGDAVAVFLNGEIFINPDYITRIQNTIKSYELQKRMK